MKKPTERTNRSWIDPGTRSRCGANKCGAAPLHLQPPEKGRQGGCGEGVGAQQVALRPRALSGVRQRARPRSPPVPPPGAAPLLPPPPRPALRAPCSTPLRARVLTRATGCSAKRARHGPPAVPGPRLRKAAGRWLGGAAARRTRRTQHPEPRACGSRRAALYIHVSGEGRRGGGSAGRGPACRPSPARDEVWDLFLGGERSWPGELKSLVCTISLTLASDFSEPQFSPTEVGLLIPFGELCEAERLTDHGIRDGGVR